MFGSYDVSYIICIYIRYKKIPDLKLRTCSMLSARAVGFLELPQLLFHVNSVRIGLRLLRAKKSKIGTLSKVQNVKK